MLAALQRQISLRIRRAKCSQPNCNSQQSQNQQIVVFGAQKYKKKGIMCTSCFIDQQLLGQLGNVQAHAISIQKFMKVLTKQYNLYAKQKAKDDWPPNLFQQEKLKLTKKVIALEKQTQKGIMEIMKYLQDAKKQAQDQAKDTNYDANFEKLDQLINQSDQNQQDRINVSNEIKQIVGKIQIQQGQYKFSTQQNLKKNNENIMNAYKKKASKAKETILKLIQVHQRCIKFLVE